MRIAPKYQANTSTSALLSASHVRLAANREGLIMTVARISEISSVSKKASKTPSCKVWRARTRR